MKIDKAEIINEIIALEPELEKDREKLNKILDDFILLKPETTISPDFKQELKDKLLVEIKNKSEIPKTSKFSFYKNIGSFILGGVLTYSVIGLSGINMDMIKSGEIGNNDVQVMQRGVPEAQQEEVGIMTMSVEPELAEENNLFTELEKYLTEIGLDKEQIEKIFEVIEKFN